MLLFTILFCVGTVFCSARAPMDRGHEPLGFMMPPIGMPVQPCMDMPMHKGDEQMPMMDTPKKYPCDSIYTKK